MNILKPNDVGDPVPPQDVFDIINKMINEAWDGEKAYLLQKKMANSIAMVLDVSTDYVYKSKWLDIEGFYRKVGWEVYYDKPAYYETYPASFTFKK